MNSILITGGTGSFGSALARRLVKAEQDEPGIIWDRTPGGVTVVPKGWQPVGQAVNGVFDRIVIYSRGEHRQEAMARDLAALDVNERLRFFIGDVRDKDRLRMAMRGIDTVVHAAAMKVVPKCEHDPIEAIKTNVLGAQNVIECALEANVRRVIALSSDKAVSPVNLYGAAKLCADKLFVAANQLVGDREIRFSVVRYGNVVGSQGSVLPLFERLAREGAATIPITHPDMTRFWITVDQGTSFVLSCLQSMEGGEIFVPKIPSMRVVDLADGVAPSIPHEIVGIRPGEKIHETLVSEDDARTTFDAGDRYIIYPERTWGNPLPEGFRYSSDTNSDWLTWDQMEEMRAA